MTESTNDKWFIVSDKWFVECMQPDTQPLVPVICYENDFAVGGKRTVRMVWLPGIRYFCGHVDVLLTTVAKLK